MVESVDKDFKIASKNIPKYLNKNMNRMRREIEGMQKELNSLGHRSIFSERKISLDGVNNRYGTTEEKISEDEEKAF